MGDYFERIVDVEVGADEAAASAALMVDWMVSRGWLTRESSGAAMYSRQVAEGYVPGADWGQIAHDWGADWVPGPVAVVAGRAAHHPGQGETEPSAAKCPGCGDTAVVIDYPNRWEADPAVWQPFSIAIDTWRQTGDATVTCRTCAAPSQVTAWSFADGFALGALAFDFWGWPPLTESFVAEFATRLGHRIVHHSGKF
ncbi:hypothetical protein [Nocardia rhizosphaerae]|uniref:Uncharacterized protein n=1 Tax=Nocardia rhizosphaerae TaxID=1691571 RepID=A0ABV8L2Y2_9NOCA